KMFELGEAQIRKVVCRDKDPSKTVTSEAQMLFAIIKEYGSNPDQPLNISRAADLAGISSKRRFLELLGELDQAGVIRTKQLLERGRPRVIELIVDSAHLRRDPPDKA